MERVDQPRINKHVYMSQVREGRGKCEETPGVRWTDKVRQHNGVSGVSMMEMLKLCKARDS